MTSLPRSTSIGARLEQLGVAARLASLRPGGLGVSSLHHAPRGQPVVVRTPRLILRPLDQNDRREFCRVAELARDHLARFMPMFDPGEDATAVFNRQLAQFEAGDQTGRDWRRVGFDSRGRLVGGFNINDIHRGLENRGELTMWISPECVGQGLGSEAIAGVVRAAFAPAIRSVPAPQMPMGALTQTGTGGSENSALESGGLGLDRLVGFISPSNEASIRLVRRAGFERTHENELVEFLLDGRPTPHEEYVLFAGPLARDKMSVVRTLADLPPSMRRDLRHILRVESAAVMRRF